MKFLNWLIKDKIYALSFVIALVMGFYNMHNGHNSQGDYFITWFTLLVVLWINGFNDIRPDKKEKE